MKLQERERGTRIEYDLLVIEKILELGGWMA